MSHLTTETLVVISYRLFGRWIPNIPSFRSDYHKSGIKTNYESYLSLSVLCAIITSTISFTFGLGIETMFLIPLNKALPGAILLGFISSMLTLSAFIIAPMIKANQNKTEIDSNLVYTIGYMNILATGGLSIERIFDRVIEVEKTKSIKELALRFTTNIQLYGEDVSSALEDVRTRSASPQFSRLLTGIVNASKTSGDLRSLLIFETKHLLALKHEQLKKTLASMVSLAELYVTAMVMAPVTFIIMITLLSVLGNAQTSMSPITQLNLIVFFGIPAICIVFIVLLDGILPKEA